MEELLERFFRMESTGVESYFDADEVVDLLDYFEESQESERYLKVLQLGEMLHPNNTEIKLRICKRHIYNQDYSSALKILEHIADSEYQDTILLRLECLCAMNRYPEVVNYLEAQKENKNEELEEIFESLAPFLNETGKSKEAKDLVKRGLSIFPDNLILKEELCYQLETQGKTKQALQLCSELIDHNPFFVDYWYIQGRLYLATAEYEKALESFDFALACDETDQEVMVLKLFSLLLNESYEKALELFIELAAIEDNLYELGQTVLSECYMNSNSFDKFYTLFRELIEKSEVNKKVSQLKFASFDYEKVEHSHIFDTFIVDELTFLLIQIFISTIKDQSNEAIHGMKELLHILYQQCLENSHEVEKLKNIHAQLLSENMIRFLKETHQTLNKDIDKSLLNIHNAFIHLLQGDFTLYSQKYEQSTSFAVYHYLKKVYDLIKKANNRQKIEFIFSYDIYFAENEFVNTEELASRFFIHKHFHN